MLLFYYLEIIILLPVCNYTRINVLSQVYVCFHVIKKLLPK